MHNFKNDGQMEISTFPRFFIKMLNYSILDHIYIWQYTVKGSIFHLIFPKIMVNDIALHFWVFGLSLKIQSRSFLHVYWSPKIP